MVSCSASSRRAGSSPASSTPPRCRPAWRRSSPTTTAPTASPTSAARRTSRSPPAPRSPATRRSTATRSPCPSGSPTTRGRLRGRTADLSGHPVRALDDGELRAAHDLFARARSTAARSTTRSGRAAARPTRRAARSACTRADALVGTAMSFPSRTAVPGGAVLPLAAVTRVGVRADRTRRGLLTALMRAQLDDLRARGDVLALLWATESAIYGRLRLRRRHPRRARSGCGAAARRCARRRPRAGRCGCSTATRSSAVLAALHDALALRRPGGITRPPGWWDAADRARRDRRHLLAAVHTGPGRRRRLRRSPAPRPRPRRSTPPCTSTTCTPLTSRRPPALWRFLLGVDLITHVEAARGRSTTRWTCCSPTRATAPSPASQDETWLRLVDVPAALAARAFADRCRRPHRCCWPCTTPCCPTTPGSTGSPGRRRRARRARWAAVRAGAGVRRRRARDGLPGRPRARPTLAATGWWTAHDPAALPPGRRAVRHRPSCPWCGTHF